MKFGRCRAVFDDVAGGHCGHAFGGMGGAGRDDFPVGFEFQIGRQNPRRPGRGSLRFRIGGGLWAVARMGLSVFADAYLDQVRAGEPDIYAMASDHGAYFGWLAGEFSQVLSERRDGRIHTALYGPNRAGHSAKPAEIYNLIASCFHAPRLEVFARDSRPGFDGWGDQYHADNGKGALYGGK